MENLNSFDQLLNYPEENGLIYESHLDEKRLYLLPNDPILNTKYIVFKRRNLLFCAYDSYAAKAGSTQTFTGVYCPIRLKPEMELELSRKHWSDYILLFNKRKTGADVIDRNFTITAAKKWNFESILSEKEVHLFLELEKQIHPLKLIIQHNYIPIISELKGMQVIGLETNQWVSKKKDVDQFLNLGGLLIENIIKASSRFF
jgi:hypothetical protein